MVPYDEARRRELMRMSTRLEEALKAGDLEVARAGNGRVRL